LTTTQIIQKLPYTAPFLFVDTILAVDEQGIQGEYTFKKEAYFYQGHFKNNPVTPGVLLTECMAQIGLASFGIYLFGKDIEHQEFSIAMTSSDMQFYIPVYPETTVQVVAEKIYFRFNKLKCKVKMYTTDQKLVAEGVIAGMAFHKTDKPKG